MKITSLQYQKNDPNRVSIFVDEQYSFSLHVNNIVKWNLYENKEVQEEEISKYVKDDLSQRLYSRSISYLGRGLRSRRQIERYLSDLLYKKQDDWFKKDMDIEKDSLIESTILQLESDGYIDDMVFGEAYLSGLSSRKAVSKTYVRGKLFEKGLAKETIDSVIEQNYPDEEEMAKKALEKKYRTSELSFDDKKKIQFLSRKGFSWSVISEIIKSDV